MYRYLIGRRCLSRLLGQPTNFSHPELIAADEVTPFIKVFFKDLKSNETIKFHRIIKKMNIGCLGHELTLNLGLLFFTILEIRISFETKNINEQSDQL